MTLESKIFMVVLLVTVLLQLGTICILKEKLKMANQAAIDQAASDLNGALTNLRTKAANIPATGDGVNTDGVVTTLETATAAINEVANALPQNPPADA